MEGNKNDKIQGSVFRNATYGNEPALPKANT